MKSKAARMIASTFRYFSGYLIPIPVMLDKLGITGKCQLEYLQLLATNLISFFYNFILYRLYSELALKVCNVLHAALELPSLNCVLGLN